MGSGYITATIAIFFFVCCPVQNVVSALRCSDIERPEHAIPPEGYVRLPQHSYYKFHPQYAPWILAKYTCQEEGGNLVVINSEAEARFVASLWNYGSAWAYIGTHDLFVEGRYVTIYNQTLPEAGFSTFSPGEPNGGTGENCGVIFRSNFLLGNYYCQSPLPFICEIEVN